MWSKSFIKNSYRIRLAAVARLLIPICFASAAYSQPYLKNWTTKDGLPQNSITGIAQTPDGYLWVSTYDGLARFDGVRFKVFNKSNTPEIENNRISTVFTDFEGRVWLTYFDETVVVHENNRFKTFQKGRDFQIDIMDDPAGVGGYADDPRFNRRPQKKFRYGQNEYVYRNGGFVLVPVENKEFPARFFMSDRESIWIENSEAFYHIEAPKVTRYEKNAALPVTPEQTAPVAGVERGSTFWFASKYFSPKDGSFLCSFRDEKLKCFPNVKDVTDLAFDNQGNLWIANAQGGLTRIGADAIERNDPSNFPADVDLTKKRTFLFRDRDENIWVGSTGGLYLVNTNPAVRVYSSADGLPADNVYPIVQDNEGTVWFGAWSGALIKYRDGKFSSEAASNLTSLFLDSRSRLWKGGGMDTGYRENGIWKPTDFYKTLPAPYNAGLLSLGEIPFITEDAKGDMWFGTENGLVRSSAGVSKLFTVSDGLPSNFLTSYLITRAGEFWVGTTGGIARMTGEKFQTFTEKDGLAGNYTRSFYEDADGTIWIGSYDSGLTRYKNGVFTKINKRNGLFSDGVFVILEDDQDWLWMNSNQGIYRVRKAELNELADSKTNTVTSVSYGLEDGLLETEGNGGKQPAGIKAADGKFWFPTAKGVAVIDPNKVKRVVSPPTVLIEEARIDQQPFAFSPDEMRLAPDQVALEIDYTAPSFVGAERTRFRYRLEGLDDNWTEADSRRTAYFAHLPYGEYTFRVIAANYEGVWNNEGATVKIVVASPFYRQWWFFVLAALALLVLTISIYKYRVRQLQFISEARTGFARRLIELQESERRRIALELHDSVGQILAVIRNRALIGLETKNQEKAHDQFREVSAASMLAITETRQIAHNLHPAQLENLGLSAALRSLVLSVESATGMNCEAEICEIDNQLPYDASINIYRISQEALSNVIKHSSASFAKVVLRIDDGGRNLVLSVEDDGRGFAETRAAQGLGLTGMHERARIIGADLNIASNPGEGTKVTLVVPLNNPKLVSSNPPPISK